MPLESLKNGPERDDNDASLKTPERVATGPFADIDHTEALPPQQIDAQALLDQMEQLRAFRNPDEEVDALLEQKSVGEDLEKVAKLIEEEKRKNEGLSAVRQSLGVPRENGEIVSKLEEARKTLEEEQRQVELAGEYNDVLSSFSELGSEEVRHIAETGTTSKGETIHNKYGKEIRSNVAKELARIHLGGKRRVTWEALTKLGQVADRILHDLASAVKGIFRSSEGGGAQERTE
ncbi:MAG TPA: hypothetical protein DEP25_04210 [Candidatus Taylorbacteria bacterium]|nr:MAG: hypothetical protein UY62_C0077G0005 [Parcubacteria group bacterium GW2011_GWF2_50_9]OHA18950.1 MAG: hypothetical protein A2759_01250 [Candidatus Taylorbacteria bacterium RIFCSPHIGHO2_01_FULL_49_60]HCB35820.1 hypothetical protein [Candidatus Taylorbacteria bacterium]